MLGMVPANILMLSHNSVRPHTTGGNLRIQPCLIGEDHDSYSDFARRALNFGRNRSPNTRTAWIYQESQRLNSSLPSVKA